MTLYRVLRDGMAQRVGDDGWRHPKVGDLINVTDQGAPPLLAGGWIEPAPAFSGYVLPPTTFLAGEAGIERIEVTPQETEPEP